MKNHVKIIAILTSFLFLFGIHPLFAATDLSCSGGTTNWNDSAVAVDPSLTVTHTANLDNALVSIDAGFVSGHDVLAFTDMFGITSSWDGASGVLTLSGTTTPANYQTALRSVTFDTTDPAATPDTTRDIGFVLGSALPNNSCSFANDHFYEAIDNGGLITWTAAETAAAARTLFGLQGYLATITCPGENDFVASKMNADCWLGGSDSAAEGTWRWVTGPEALEDTGGRRFWDGDSTGSAYLGRYNNWNTGEPNDVGAGEDYLYFRVPGGNWNDYPHDGTVSVYLVEYGDTAGDQAANFYDTKQIGPQEPQEPQEPPSTPRVINVTSTASCDGSYTVGSVIVITMRFSHLVWVKGTPQLVLRIGETPATSYYDRGSGTNILTFLYTVNDGDDLCDMDYWSQWALELNGGRIYNNHGVDVDSDLPVPGEPGSLGYNMAQGVLGKIYPVYRFYSPGLLKYLFTIDENEKNHLLANAADVWRYEYVAYYAYLAQQYEDASRQQKNTLQAVHRFYSEALMTHLFTIDENEKEHLIANAADVWRYEGVAFYVPADYQEGTLPVYRFYSEALMVHLFTIDENEKNHLIDTAGDIWNFEGIAYYAFP